MSRVKRLPSGLVNKGRGFELGDEIAVLLALEGEQTGEFSFCVGM